VSDTVIKVENLSKKYTIRHQQPQQYTSLRDVITEGVQSIGRRLIGAKQAPSTSSTQEEFWALKDVSFEIKQGEAIGIIGCNGAGKSTLLKILSRITEPTLGQVTIRGRVASLLEVGTGFHPELTGRENIYLNGAILGMNKLDIKRKFDEIVAFAEIEKFLDTPVKRYSSGMYVRLAFAVAAHLEPEILIVDEVLAVGDAAFQKKCLGKIGEVTTSEGRTVLFVSHNVGAIRLLCQDVYLFDKGLLAMKASAEECISQYLQINGKNKLKKSINLDRPLNTQMWVSNATLLCNKVPSKYLIMGETLSFELKIQSIALIKNIKIGFVIFLATGEPVLNANNRYQPCDIISFSGSEKSINVTCCLGVVPLMPNRYTVSFWLGDETQDVQKIDDALVFEVIAKDIWGEGQVPPSNASALWWNTEFIQECKS
jgi:lipopolysaccharide transport system ATP-binding protein